MLAETEKVFIVFGNSQWKNDISFNLFSLKQVIGKLWPVKRSPFQGLLDEAHSESQDRVSKRQTAN